MNEFLNALERALSGIDAQQKREILTDYREHFALGLAAGKTEAQIARDLGDPEQLAKMFLALKAAREARQGGFTDAMRMIGTVLSFRIGGGLLMGVIYFAVFGTIALLYAVAATLVAGGAACVALAVVEAVRGFGLYAALAVFTALALASGGLLWLSGNTRLWRACAARLPLLARRMTKPERKGEAT